MRAHKSPSQYQLGQQKFHGANIYSHHIPVKLPYCEHESTGVKKNDHQVIVVQIQIQQQRQPLRSSSPCLLGMQIHLL